MSDFNFVFTNKHAITCFFFNSFMISFQIWKLPKLESQYILLAGNITELARFVRRDPLRINSSPATMGKI